MTVTTLLILRTTNKKALSLVEFSIKFIIWSCSSKIILVFKKSDEENVENYRPNSIVPVFSKVLERIMYNRLHEYFMNNNLFHENEFGFQINNSTEHAVLQFTGDTSQNG